MKTIIVAAAVVAGAGLASAQDLRIDLSDTLGTTDGNWNNVYDLLGTTSGLIDYDTGANTGVSITGAGDWQHFYGDEWNAFPEQDWLVHPATADGAGLQDGETGTFTLAGLTASAYRIEVVSARTEFEYLNYITIGGAAADSTYLGTPVVTPWNATTDGLEAGNWLIWSNVAPVNGELTILVVADPATLAIVNAIRVVAVPAPGAGLVLAMGAAFVGRRRR